MIFAPVDEPKKCNYISTIALFYIQVIMDFRSEMNSSNTPFGGFYRW